MPHVSFLLRDDMRRTSGVRSGACADHGNAHTTTHDGAMVNGERGSATGSAHELSNGEVHETRATTSHDLTTSTQIMRPR